MSLQALSPAWFVAGLVGLAAVLGVLHLLRVRLRRVVVPTLLFYQAIGEVRQPRTLLGRPSRLLAFLIALALVAAAWTAIADPVLERDGPSRVVVVDTSGTGALAGADGVPLLTQRLQTATALAGGLGPRGAVLAYDGEVRTLLLAGEPLPLLAWRAARHGASGPGSALFAALRDARDRLRDEGDEVVVLGGPAALPTELAGVPVRRIAAAAAPPPPAFVDLRVVAWPERKLVAEVAQGQRGDIVELAIGETVEKREVTAGTRRIELPLPTASVAVTVRLTRGGTAHHTVSFDLPAQRTTGVRIEAGVPEVVTAIVDADPALEVAEEARVRVASTVSEGDVATLQIVDGEEPAAREPLATAACPIALSLRDRRQESATCLPVLPGETVWVEDARSGAPLAGAHVANGRLRVRIARWLLEESAHRDVPRLVAGSLRLLAGQQLAEVPLQVAGRPFRVASPTEDALQLGAVAILPVASAYPCTMTAPTTATLALAGADQAATAVVAVSVPAPPEPASGDAGTPASLGGDGRLWPIFLLAALALLLLDVWLYHRGRLP